MDRTELWKRYRRYLCTAPSVGLRLDVSRMNFDEAFLEGMAEPMARALAAMERLERGAKANADEDRMVGHYWLRAPRLAPSDELRRGIEQTIEAVKRFAGDVHSGVIAPERGDAFDIVLVIGIGGSALGPQLVSDALGGNDDPMIVRFLDNTDPDGIDRVLSELDEAIGQTLTIVVSKSGGTKETRNAMVETAAAYQRAGLSFAKHAVAVTCPGSALEQQAVKEKWRKVLPLWDWVGGRTSVTSAVGLLPAALQGVDIDAFLTGARECDRATRERDPRKNPAAMLSLMWHYAGSGRGDRNMVVLPYCDRLTLFGKYLQQLVMESLGKEKDRDGQVVGQGLTVFGNKGSTDQHAYVQQLRDGRNDFFVTFIDVMRDRQSPSIEVEDGVTSSDYLQAFRLGTREALHARGRESISLTLDELNAHRLGAMIALFERTVGLYAELIHVNAYDQPGVEAGKKAAGVVLELQHAVLGHLCQTVGRFATADEIAAAIGRPEDAETVFHILEHLASVVPPRVERTDAIDPGEARYRVAGT